MILGRVSQMRSEMTSLPVYLATCKFKHLQKVNPKRSWCARIESYQKFADASKTYYENIEHDGMYSSKIEALCTYMKNRMAGLFMAFVKDPNP